MVVGCRRVVAFSQLDRYSLWVGGGRGSSSFIAGGVGSSAAMVETVLLCQEMNCPDIGLFPETLDDK